MSFRANSSQPACRHCRKRPAGSHHRGLCRTCHADLSIRLRYPLVHLRRKDQGERPPCCHCHERRACWHRRGLCRICHSDLSIRERYQGHGKGNRGFDTREVLPDPVQPTPALPGTGAKIEALHERAHEQHTELFHRQDPVSYDATRTVFIPGKGGASGRAVAEMWRQRTDTVWEMAEEEEDRWQAVMNLVRGGWLLTEATRFLREGYPRDESGQVLFWPAAALPKCGKRRRRAPIARRHRLRLLRQPELPFRRQRASKRKPGWERVAV